LNRKNPKRLDTDFSVARLITSYFITDKILVPFTDNQYINTAILAHLYFDDRVVQKLDTDRLDN
jgi:hypothetical protein